MICASTGNTAASAAAYAGRAGTASVRADSEGRGGARQALAERDAWRARDRGDRQLRHLLEGRARCRGARPGGNSAGQQRQSRSYRRPEDRGLRDLRSAWRRADASFFAGRQRRQHHRVLGRLPGIQSRRAVGAPAEDDGLPGGRVGADRASAIRSTTRIRWRPRSKSAIRRAGRARPPRATSRAASSTWSPMRRFSPRTG